MFYSQWPEHFSSLRTMIISVKSGPLPLLFFTFTSFSCHQAFIQSRCWPAPCAAQASAAWLGGARCLVKLRDSWRRSRHERKHLRLVRRMFLLELIFEYPDFLKVAIFAPKSISRPSNINKLHRQEIDIAPLYQLLRVARPRPWWTLRSRPVHYFVNINLQ